MWKKNLFGVLSVLIMVGFTHWEGLAHAEETHHPNFLSIKGGSFSPAEEGQGTGVNFMVGYDHILENGFGVGFEMGYKNFNRDMTVDVIGAKDITGEVEVTSIPLFFNVKYHFITEVVRPYLGIGAGVSFNSVDFDEIDKIVDEKGYTWLKKEDDGAGFGVQGLAGIRFVIANRVSFFVEGKYSWEGQELEGIENDDIMNFGGFYGTGGIGVEF
jgi:hypothetical protein